MWFVSGLGNPEKKYQNTRHNIGFDFVDSIVDKYNFKLNKKDKLKEIFRGKIADKNYIFCKPLTYMNLSGPVIEKVVNFYKIPKSKILIIHDDIDLTVSKVKIKIGGGNGGHNGLSSIDQTIGTNYKRLRIGIGHPGSKDLVSSYVLDKFNKIDRKIIDRIIKFLTQKFTLIFENDRLILTKLASEIIKINNGL